MFYKACRSTHHYHQKRMFTIKKFTLKDKEQSDGYLIKFETKKTSIKLNLIKEQVRKLIISYPDSLFIFTTPTIEFSGEYGNFPYPGHNFVLISSQTSNISKEENILSCMSKRPGKEVLTQRRRAWDERFDPSYLPIVRIYTPRFTFLEEEIEVWERKALTVSEYPLFLHIIPLKSELNISAETFKNNVQDIFFYNSPYSLHSTIHPTADHLIPPANCNGAVHEALFGTPNAMVQNMFCQEAVMKIVKPFIQHWDLYEELAIKIGLTKGIKSFLIEEENYRPAFTC